MSETHKTFTLTTEMITLGQLLKAVGYVGSGSGVKDALRVPGFTVNGEIENRRGRKLFPGDMVEMPGELIVVLQSAS